MKPETYSIASLNKFNPLCTNTIGVSNSSPSSGIFIYAFFLSILVSDFVTGMLSYVIILCFFFVSPKNPALLGLNVNHGVHVKLRLRRPNRDSEFYPFHQILDTMLHELCHNAHGPHNAVFYKLWDHLRKVASSPLYYLSSFYYYFFLLLILIISLLFFEPEIKQAYQVLFILYSFCQVIK